MLNKGVPKEVLQTLLGHRSIKTTEIYANWVRKEELESWVKIFSNITEWCKVDYLYAKIN